MGNPASQCAELLKQAGYSLTAPRQTVFLLLHGKEPVSMRELTEMAKGKMDRASVYRTVELFERLGIIRRINIGWKYKLELSDAFADHHHHLTCLGCQTIIPINEQTLEQFVDTIAAAHRFLPTEHQIEIQGYCHTCARRP